MTQYLVYNGVNAEPRDGGQKGSEAKEVKEMRIWVWVYHLCVGLRQSMINLGALEKI